MINKILTTSLLLVTVSACAGGSYHSKNQAQFMKKNDKQLTCRELLLEMNEAEFFAKAAARNSDTGIGTLLSPIDSYKVRKSAEKTIDDSHARVEYLNQIYTILNCNGRKGYKAANYERLEEQSAPEATLSRGGKDRVGKSSKAPVEEHVFRSKEPQVEEKVIQRADNEFGYPDEEI